MAAHEVTDGMVVAPNCVYIIPPGYDMALLNGSLQLLKITTARGQRLPIDFFFRSLAQDQRERAIGIILSGTGSDGTLGVRAIKEENGMVIVQIPESAEFDGMPRNAIATGLVDYELPPAEMPAKLVAYAEHLVGRRPIDVIPHTESETSLKKIFLLLRTQTGHDFSLYKPTTINRRIERRMALQQIDRLESYVSYLNKNAVFPRSRGVRRPRKRNHPATIRGASRWRRGPYLGAGLLDRRGGLLDRHASGRADGIPAPQLSRAAFRHGYRQPRHRGGPGGCLSCQHRGRCFPATIGPILLGRARFGRFPRE
jgi:hypothetical protein